MRLGEISRENLEEMRMEISLEKEYTNACNNERERTVVASFSTHSCVSNCI